MDNQSELRNKLKNYIAPSRSKTYYKNHKEYIHPKFGYEHVSY